MREFGPIRMGLVLGGWAGFRIELILIMLGFWISFLDRFKVLEWITEFWIGLVLNLTGFTYWFRLDLLLS